MRICVYNVLVIFFYTHTFFVGETTLPDTSVRTVLASTAGPTATRYEQTTSRPPSLSLSTPAPACRCTRTRAEGSLGGARLLLRDVAVSPVVHSVPLPVFPLACLSPLCFVLLLSFFPPVPCLCLLCASLVQCRRLFPRLTLRSAVPLLLLRPTAHAHAVAEQCMM